MLDDANDDVMISIDHLLGALNMSIVAHCGVLFCIHWQMFK